MNPIRDAWIGIGLAAAYFIQAVLLVFAEGAVSAARLPFLAGALAAAAAAGAAWTCRQWLGRHADSLLLMGGFGGFGMLLGGMADRGPACHLGVPDIASWMSAGMMAGGMVPAAAWGRCLREARHDGRFLRAALLDATGMWLGMAAAPAAVAALPRAPDLGLWAHPLLVAGMVGGMAVSMSAADALAGCGKRLEQRFPRLLHSIIRWRAGAMF